MAPAELRPLAEVERDYITAVVRASGGNRARAAASLGIGEATLYRKLKEYGKANTRLAGRLSSCPPRWLRPICRQFYTAVTSRSRNARLHRAAAAGMQSGVKSLDSITCNAD